MKKIIFLLVLLITSTIFAQEEVEFCQTPSSSTHLSELENIRGLDHTNDIFNLKIYIHVLRKQTEPKLGQSIEGINRVLKILYDDYDPLGINFVWDGNVHYIENNTYYYDPIENAEAILNSFNHTDGIDIYFSDDEQEFIARANDIGGSSLILGGSFGGHSFGGYQTPTSWLKAITHEMGHVLYLWHTHHGTTLDPLENAGDPNACPEIVNPINETQQLTRTHCGDYIADTPADPGIYFRVLDFDSCEFLPMNNPDDYQPEVDENGDEFNPDTSNFMSYTYPTCMSSFTNKQKSRMKNAIWYLPVLNNTLLDDYTYVRALSNENCYVCGDSFYEIYSSVDIAQLSIISSSNVTVQITNTSNNSFTLKVFNNLNQNANEGERGSFSIVNSGRGIIVAHQPIWVGKPQAVPDNSINGPIEVSSGVYESHEIGDGNIRLDGINYYKWEFPEPNEPFEGGYAGNPSVWEYRGFSKYIPGVTSNTGNDTGIVTVRGENPCGLGDNGEFNDLCVVNLDDNDGEPDCSFTPGAIYYYPNPTGSLLQIDLSLQAYKIFDVIIYDENQTVKYSDQSENVIKTVDTFNLTNGTYYLHIYDGSNLILSAILIINH